MKQRRRRIGIKIAVGILFVLLVVFLLGPRPKPVNFTDLHERHFTTDLKMLEDSLNAAEATLPLKKDNQARIVWDTPYVKTPYSIVYLHGNGASQEEGDPIHEALAHRYGCNLYLARLADHGLQEEEPLLHLDASVWMQSALDAIEMGRAIGDKVILVSCSTGSTLGLYLEAHNPGLVSSHIMFSPNIDVFDPKSFVLVQPWGLPLARQILGGKNYSWKAPQTAQNYWYTSYRIEGLITLKSVIEETMSKSTFGKIKDPVFMSYYFLDKEHQDSVVSVRRMLDMYKQLGTPENLKRSVALTDAGTHVIASDIFNDHLGSLWTPLTAFCEEVLHLMPVDSSDYITYKDLR